MTSITAPLCAAAAAAGPREGVSRHYPAPLGRASQAGARLPPREDPFEAVADELLS